MYRYFFKRLFDIICSLLCLIILSPFLLIISIIIKIDSKGPVIFKQKRVGKNKKLFNIWKFRSMPISAPHDTPTHQLQNAEAMLSKWQKFIRKTSLDELPQLFCILFGKMSFVGPRPALWNQDDLIAERDNYGANDVVPGLTGLAQVSGRDELEIPLKARIDGEYSNALKAGKFKGFAMDIKCLFKTVLSVLKSDGVVEGGTGELAKKESESKNEEEQKGE